MSETRATSPVFPPGRYGRRRGRRRRPYGPVLVAGLVLAASVLLAVALYTRYGDPDYDPQIVGWRDATDTSLTVTFRVRVPAGGAADCVVRARSYDGADVGRRRVTVTAPRGAAVAQADVVVPTTARASVGDVPGCRAAG